jgi:hypothetical protein
LFVFLAFYDPDGYYFNEKGFDEYGGRYDERGFYHPGKGNKHEFDSVNHEEYGDEFDDDLIR